MKSTFPTVSVIIPVKNEALKIRACIDGILKQTVPLHEIIVIDSGSTDDTVHILQTYPQVTLIEIPTTSFNHGETRNLGVQKASGEFLLFTVGDARPINEHWIETMLNGFIDEEVAGVCGQQAVPHEVDKNPIEWFRPISEPLLIRYQYKAVSAFEALEPLEKKNTCAWDDVNAMYRKSVIQELPFRRTSYGEDAIWAKEAILNGHAIVYQPKARVYHYHLEDADFVFKRNFTTMYFRYRQFGYLQETPVLGIRSKLSIIKRLLQLPKFSFKKIFYWWNYNIKNFKAAQLSHQVFMESLIKGEEELDKVHEKLCGKPPIPLKIMKV
jgi:rhamnosyltransferase